ncbi:MAG: hypothetical protein QXM92_02925 [Candidatus Anstonellales archaeon]
MHLHSSNLNFKLLLAPFSGRGRRREEGREREEMEGRMMNLAKVTSYLLSQTSWQVRSKKGRGAEV